jgi:glycosyltransferase involved in cell wall biosynthesis
MSKPQIGGAASSDCSHDENAKPAVAVIIPAYNEEKSIAHVLGDIPRQWVRTIVVVDNGSSDRTAEYARLHGATVVPEPQRGYGAACLAGIASLTSNIEIIVFLDADYSDFPEELEKVVAPIVQGQADMVIGTRMHDRATRACLTPQQRYGNKLATFLIKCFWGFRYSDLGPFRAINRKSLDLLQMEDRNFGWTVEMQIKAVQKGLKIAEVPVQYRVRIGRSKISGTLKGTILAGTKILYTVFRYALASRNDRQQ